MEVHAFGGGGALFAQKRYTATGEAVVGGFDGHCLALVVSYGAGNFLALHP